MTEPGSRKKTMPDPTSCAKCGSVIKEGFTLDISDKGFHISEWMMGAPVWGLFGSLKADRRNRLRTRTFACMSCGYLESYLAFEEK